MSEAAQDDARRRSPDRPAAVMPAPPPGTSRRRVHLLIVLVDLLALVSLLLLPFDDIYRDPISFSLLATLAALAGVVPVRIPAIHVAVSPLEPFLFASLVVLGGLPSVLLVVLSLLSSAVLRRPTPKLEKLAFNLGTLSLATVAGHLCLRALLVADPQRTPGAFLAPLAAAATVYFFVNTALVTSVICLDRGGRFLSTWTASGLWTAVSNYVGLTLGAGLIFVLTKMGPAWLALGVPPVWLLLQFYRAHRDRIEQQQRRIEEVVELARHAEEASRAKSQFLANMSHEIRTPMNGVLGMLDLLAGTSLDARQTRYVSMARSSADALLGLLNDILDVSKIEAGRVDLEEVAFDLRAAIEDVRDVFLEHAHRKNLELATMVPADVPSVVRGDPSRIRQVLINLVGNAVKFTDSGRVLVRVGCERSDGQQLLLRFEVLDTGIGIEPDARERVFDPFTQADGSTTRRYGGTGLGLTIARQLAHMMGGQIGVDSEPGRGSTFWFTARLRLAAAAPEPARQRSSRAPRGTPLRFDARVLLAEDNAINQEVARSMLEALGCRVESVANGRAAHDALAREAFDVVLMDCMMPEMDGYEAAAEIRRLGLKDRRGRPLPVIALTANAMKGDRERCLAAGMDDHLPKPLRRCDIEETFERWLGETSVPAPTPDEPADPAALPAHRPDPAASAGAAFPPAGVDRARNPIDERALEEIRGLDPGGVKGLLGRFVAMFLARTREHLTQLEEALRRCDAKQVREIAHTLKSSSAYVGASGLSASFRQLEALSRQDRLDGAGECLERIRAEYELAEEALLDRCPAARPAGAPGHASNG